MIGTVFFIGFSIAFICLLGLSSVLIDWIGERTCKHTSK